MINAFLKKVKGLLFSPTGAFQASREETMAGVLGYFAIFLLIFVIVFGILVGLLFTSTDGITVSFLSLFEVLVIIIMMIIVGIIAALLETVILHIGVLIVGGKQGITETLKVVACSFTPILVLAWIPFVVLIFGWSSLFGLIFGVIPFLGLIAAIWSLVIKIIGLSELQEISTARAIFAILIPMAFVIILSIVAAGFFMISAFSSTMVP